MATIDTAEYNASTGVLIVNGTGISSTADIIVTGLTISGGGISQQLSSGSTAVRNSNVKFTVTLSSGDKVLVNAILNNNGTAPVSGAAYNLAGATGWYVGSAADLTSNAITVSNAVANTAPTLTSFAAVVDTVNEDTEVEITFAELTAQGNEADADGTVDAFVVQAVSSGTLKIGADAGSATAYAAGTNDTISSTLKAYWTPASNASGTLNTFTVKAKDNSGALSATAIQAQVSVIAVNDAPTLTSFAAVVDTVNQNTEVNITFAELTAQGNEADVDGTVDAFVVQAVSSGTLKIGTSAGSAGAYAAGTNDIISSTLHAYWTPATNASGTLNAFTVKAKDNSGALSATAIQAQVSVTAVSQPEIAYSATTFTEAAANNGTVTTSVTLTLSGDTYSAGVVDNNKITASNVPAGLTANFVRTSDTVITATLTGTATAHANANDIANLTFTFADGAFTNTATAANVSNY
ncbi:MAG: hypothetical protein AABY17_01010, partial [Thermoproteota archaeon]